MAVGRDAFKRMGCAQPSTHAATLHSPASMAGRGQGLHRLRRKPHHDPLPVLAAPGAGASSTFFSFSLVFTPLSPWGWIHHLCLAELAKQYHYDEQDVLNSHTIIRQSGLDQVEMMSSQRK